MALPVGVQESLSSLRSDQTTIIVAHRLSTVMDADIIIVMQVASASSQLICFSVHQRFESQACWQALG